MYLVVSEHVRAQMPMIVGRDGELEAIRDLIASLDDGPGGLFLHGAPGIGKSRLWSEGVRRARSLGVRVLVTRPGGSDARVAFAGLRDLVGDAVGDVLPVLPEPQRRALAVALLFEEPGTAPVDSDVVSASFAAALRVLGRGGRLLIAVDDAQWLDASSRAALAFALRRLDEDRVGVLATVRTQRDIDVDDLVLALSPECVRRRDVGPLTVAELYHLVVDRFGLRLGRPILLRLHELSGGSPFFALEIARGLGSDDRLSVPPELSGLLRARLAALSPPTQQVMLVAATLARPTRALLEDVCGEVDAALDEGSAAEIVETNAEVVRFSHPLLASVHYAAASLRSRRAVHCRIAGVGVDVEERARHLALAAAGPDEDVAKVLDEAVRIARGRGALASAAELAEEALTMTPRTDSARHARTLAAAALIFSSGDTAGADRLLAAALARVSDDRERVELLAERGRVAHELDQPQAAAILGEALDLVGDDALLRVDVLVRLASTLYSLRRLDDAIIYSEDAVRVAENSGDTRTLASALGAAAFFEFEVTGAIPESLFRRAIALEEADGIGPDAESSALADYGQVLLEVWNLDRAREIFERLVTRARVENSAGLAAHLDCLAFVELCAGHLDRAATLAREAVDIASQTGRANTEVFALFRLGWIEGLCGDVDGARRTCERSLRLAAKTSGFVRGARLSLGYLESSLEDYDAAWSFLDPANPATGEASNSRPVVPVAETVEVLAALGRTDEARTRLEPFANLAEALSGDWAIARAAHCRGLILAAEGDLEAAEQEAADAAELSEANGWPLPLGRALLALGTVQRRRQHKAAARASLERAAAVLGEAGARIWCERAQHELARIGGRRSPAGDRLSATESRIVELVATGCSNKQVAATLHVSPKTVEWNLSKIYRKLDVRSRTELAARIAGE